MHDKTRPNRPVNALALVIALVGLWGLVGLAQAHPGHAAPDIVHGVELLATAAPPDAAAGQWRGTSLALAVLGAVLILLGPLAGRVGRHLPNGALRLSRPLGLACAAVSVVLAVGAF